MGELHGDHRAYTHLILIVGRPVLIKDEDFDTPLPAVDVVWSSAFVTAPIDVLYRRRIISVGHRRPQTTSTFHILLCQDELQVISALWQVYVGDLLALILINQK